jgi:23S rRNA pseudouridine1911/1915/1917 synthase
MVEKKKEILWKWTAGESDRGMRLDKFWAGRLADEGVSRGRVKTWIEDGLATVNNAVVDKGKFKLSEGDVLAIGSGGTSLDEDAPQAVPGGLEVLFEDEHMLVVNKPAGVTTHPAPGEPGPTLVNFLLHQWPDMAADVSGMDGQRPGIVHRLDKDTSGIMAVARTEAARLKLASEFAGRRTHKVYLAIVHGCPERGEGIIEAPVGRHQTQKTRMAVLEKGGREAKSEYRVIWTGPRGLASLVAVRIFTGRTHQIRVHMAHIGHPLLGDAVYGPRENAEWARRPDSLAGLAPRQMLHAFYLSVTHPDTGEPVTRWLEPPEDFRRLLAGLTRECLRVGIVGMPGSGKSALLGMLRDMGLPCFSADETVAGLYGPGGDGSAMIRQRFGGRFTRDDGAVDKPALFAAMQESGGVRRDVMDMVHPMVRHACEEFFKVHRDEPAAYAEIPLLLEGGWQEGDLVDMVAGVACPDAKRTGELREKRGLDRETMAVFDSWQWPEDRKLAACDLVLNNTGTLDDLAGEARRLRDHATGVYTARNQAFSEWLADLWSGLAGEIDVRRAAR